MYAQVARTIEIARVNLNESDDYSFHGQVRRRLQNE